jgi:DNA-directed RNA polymerase specialized sigma24 family protein
MTRPRVSSAVDLPPFQALLDAHSRDVHRFLIATVGRIDADDCYQETWLAALRAYPKLRDASNLRSWILTVAHRKAIDHIRARRRRAVPVAETEALVGAGAGSGPSLPPPGDPGDSGVWGQVAELPDKQRTALALRFVADLAYAEIGGVMATSEEAARRNVHEGLKRLRKEYRND